MPFLAIITNSYAIKLNNKPVRFECQSGLDGRLLERDQELAHLLRKAHFHNIRIAWDNSLSDCRSIKKQLDILVTAGYRIEDIYVFMIYNYDVPYEKMLKKVDYCKKWGVQIADCRYRPLDSLKDDYNPRRYKEGQTNDDYYIHTKTGWSDRKIREFRKRVRQHNIWVRYAMDKSVAYDKKMEEWSRIHTTLKFFRMGHPPQLDVIDKSATWKKRIEMLKRVRNYYRKNNMNSLDFSDMGLICIDKELRRILQKIDSGENKS